MMVSKLTGGRGLVEAGVKVFENVNLKKQQAATRQGSVGMLVCYEEIMTENARYLSRQTSLSDLLTLIVLMWRIG